MLLHIDAIVGKDVAVLFNNKITLLERTSLCYII